MEIWLQGSVIPLFYDQIINNKPITITDPNMTRFMTLDHAVEHYLHLKRKLEIFCQKAPSTTIGELAKVMKQIYNSKSKINIIGIRHGEKIHETLLSKEEKLVSDDLVNILEYQLIIVI